MTGKDPPSHPSNVEPVTELPSSLLPGASWHGPAMPPEVSSCWEGSREWKESTEKNGVVIILKSYWARVNHPRFNVKNHIGI